MNDKNYSSPITLLTFFDLKKHQLMINNPNENK